jgi:hypothetical protein
MMFSYHIFKDKKYYEMPEENGILIVT